LHIHKRDPAAVIALFPSDHFVLEEDVFMKQVERAFRIVELDNTRIVLLGTVPDEPDPEYGYIIPGEQLGNPGLETRKVEMFVEKPSTDAAKMIMSKGALWNTLIIVVTSATLLQAIKSAAPALFRSFEPILDAIGTPDERRVVERVYQKLPSLNFSRAVLEALAHENRQNLRVLPVQGVNWKDWGSGTRLVATLRQLGVSDLAIPEAPAAQPETFSMAAKDNVIALRRRS
jgi:mannose-1-phosphate guanylyltransferase